jgi:hypothetical protein
VFKQLGILDVSQLVRVERFLELHATLVPNPLETVDSHKFHSGHLVICPLILEPKGFSGGGGFPTQANDTRKGNAYLREFIKELIERVIRVTTDEDLAVRLIMENFG